MINYTITQTKTDKLFDSQTTVTATIEAKNFKEALKIFREGQTQ